MTFRRTTAACLGLPALVLLIGAAADQDQPVDAPAAEGRAAVSVVLVPVDLPLAGDQDQSVIRTIDAALNQLVLASSVAC